MSGYFKFTRIEIEGAVTRRQATEFLEALHKMPGVSWDVEPALSDHEDSGETI